MIFQFLSVSLSSVRPSIHPILCILSTECLWTHQPCPPTFCTADYA